MLNYRSIEIAWRNFADSKKTTFLQKCVKVILAPFGYLFALISTIRNKAYDLKIFKSFKPGSIAVISIGNLTLGGTGKTPLTILIANMLEHSGLGAVLSRGYGRKSKEPLVIHQNNYHLHSPQETGDEPYLIAKKTNAHVIINTNREKALIDAHIMGCRWALLDDGFQRRQTARDLDIVVVGETLFGNELCFPAGPLREPISNLKRADLIVMIGDSKIPLVNYTSAPIILAKWHPLSLSSDSEKLPFLKGDSVALFCGIGNPSLFLKTVTETGLLVKDCFIVEDHKVPNFDEIMSFWSSCKGCHKLLCTEKDYVKLDSRIKMALPIYYVESELQIIDGEQILQHALSNIL